VYIISYTGDDQDGRQVVQAEWWRHVQHVRAHVRSAGLPQRKHDHHVTGDVIEAESGAPVGGDHVTAVSAQQEARVLRRHEPQLKVLVDDGANERPAELDRRPRLDLDVPRSTHHCKSRIAHTL